MAKISKYDILKLLSKKLTIYAATQWLKMPHEDLEGKSPSDLIDNGDIQEAYNLLSEDLKKKEK